MIDKPKFNRILKQSIRDCADITERGFGQIVITNHCLKEMLPFSRSDVFDTPLGDRLTCIIAIPFLLILLQCLSGYVLIGFIFLQELRKEESQRVVLPVKEKSVSVSIIIKDLLIQSEFGSC